MKKREIFNNSHDRVGNDIVCKKIWTFAQIEGPAGILKSNNLLLWNSDAVNLREVDKVCHNVFFLADRGLDWKVDLNYVELCVSARGSTS